MDNERIKSRLKKLLALARRGEGGEKINAQRMLEATLKKHGMTMEDLDDSAETPQEVKFKFVGPLERDLLGQILVMVFRARTVETYGYRRFGKAVRGLVGVMATRAQAVEIEVAFEAHKKALKAYMKKQAGLAFNAYVQTNELYSGIESDDKSKSKMSMADLMAIKSMMDRLEPTPVHRQIESRV